LDPTWQLEFGTNGVPIKEVLVLGRATVTGSVPAFNTVATGYSVYVGEDSNYSNNPTCTGNNNIYKGSEFACNKSGKYLTVQRAGQRELSLTGIAAFLDCGSSSLPWDTISGFPSSFELGETQQIDISLATTFEAAVGVNACG